MVQPLEYPAVSMEGVSYGGIPAGVPVNVSVHQPDYTYLYVVRDDPVELVVQDPEEAKTLIVPKGGIVSISGLIPHLIRSANAGRERKQDLREVLQPLPQVDPGRVGLVVGQFCNSEYAVAGAYLGVHLVTEATAPEVYRRLWETHRFIEDELRDPMVNAETAVQLLSETLLVYGNRLVRDRRYAKSLPLRSERDRSVVQVMLEIGLDPCKDWNLNSLASLAGMSRTAFAVSFRKLLGKTPMELVWQTRLSRALYLLEHTRESVEQIAQNSGYGSAAAFVRAFKKKHGTSPARWRRASKTIEHRF